MDERRITIRVPENVYKAYRVLLLEEGSTMQEDLLQLIRRRLEEAGRLPPDAGQPKGRERG